jgi:solute carrier family 50 protein (sugar transporter)
MDVEQPTLLDYAKVVWDVTAQHTKAPIAHEMLVLFMVIFWTAVLCLIGWADSFSSGTKNMIVGTISNLNLVFFYGAPLSTIFQVLKTRSSSSIHVLTMVINTVTSAFWVAFGVAASDLFISVPNGLGTLLGVIQFLLCFLFPRTKRADADNQQAAEPSSKDDALELPPTDHEGAGSITEASRDA